jgi:hypothetical protein
VDASLATRFSPSDLGFIAHPYDVYAELREHAPVLYHEEVDHWLVARYEGVNSLLRDRRVGRTYLARPLDVLGLYPDPSPSFISTGLSPMALAAASLHALPRGSSRTSPTGSVASAGVAPDSESR